jgi:hypothetical protein
MVHACRDHVCSGKTVVAVGQRTNGGSQLWSSPLSGKPVAWRLQSRLLPHDVRFSCSLIRLVSSLELHSGKIGTTRHDTSSHNIILWQQDSYELKFYIYLYIYIYGSTTFVDLGRFFSFLILYTVGRTLWTGVQPVVRPIPTHRTT